MAEFELSTYQKEIVDYYFANPSSNILINALAGVGKSWILCYLLEQSKTSDVYLAFNNMIAEEFRGKIKNPKVKVYTSHSLALSIMNSNLGNNKGGIGQARTKDNEKAQLDNLKAYKIVDEMITNSYGRRFNWDERCFLKNNYVQLYNLARLTCSLGDERKISQLVDEHGLFIDLENNFSTPDYNVIYAWICELDEKSLQEFELEKIIDFPDMLYITVKKLQSKEWTVPYYNLYTNIAVDENQDSSKLILNFIRFIKRPKGRYIFCQDKNQAIYAFCGGNAQAYAETPRMFKPIKEFDLPINYRCPASHLKYVNKNFGIPIQARPNAPQGEIKTIEKTEIAKYVQIGDMIISRKNKWFAPLLLDLASRGIPVYIEDKEMVESIKKLIKAQKVVGCTGLKHKFEETINEFQNKIRKIITDAQNPDSLTDINEASTKTEAITERLDNINFVLALLNPYVNKKEHATTEEFLNYLTKILNTTSPKNCVRICSVHKAKGLEAKNVFVLNEAKVWTTFRMSQEQREQEVNLAYISVTRAMDKLYLVKEPDEDG